MQSFYNFDFLKCLFFLRMVLFLKPLSPAVSSEAENLHELGPSFFFYYYYYLELLLWSGSI